MAKKLINKSVEGTKGGILVKNSVPFKISFENKIDNKFSFKKLKENNIKDFQKFLDSTVYKGLSISEVDDLYLRKKGNITETCSINGITRDIMHYGKDRDKFRVHGYYNENSYFVIYRIDPNHKVHEC